MRWSVFEFRPSGDFVLVKKTTSKSSDAVPVLRREARLARIAGAIASGAKVTDIAEA